ncbi:response regulator transcription factor [Streptomyces sp. NPDC006314]|uniref:helix-turn-helix transcriptional regulator n=1 Tax=Streptomyces sp. NPDC006314 TaxID=3154475 RepID=UPI0033A0C276
MNVILSVRDDLQRYGLEGMLRPLRGVATCRAFADLTSAVDAVSYPATDLLIVAPQGTDLDPDSVLHRVVAYGVRVLLLLPDLDSVDLARVAALPGASLLCSDGLQIEDLHEVLTAMSDGGVHIPASLTRDLLELAGRGSRPGPVPPRLTPREREALTHLVEGLSNKQIARRLHISEHGVKRLVANILAKLNCPNRTLATVRAIRDGLCAPPAPQHTQHTERPVPRHAGLPARGGGLRHLPAATDRVASPTLTNGW